MDIWSRARSFAQEAAKKSQELTAEAAKRSQELTIGGSHRFVEIVSEASKRSKELAAEASNCADQIKLEAIKRADKIKSISLIESASLPNSLFSDPKQPGGEDTFDEVLHRYGVTDELREFVNEINISTFQEFPLPNDSPTSDVPTVLNVRQDLTEWQAKHATLVLSTVKAISKLRYELCPRVMKERKFWRIYFMLVNRHISSFEKRYMEEFKLKAEQVEQKKSKQASESGTSKPDVSETIQASMTSKSSADQDLDVFLLGDLGDSDDDADDKDEDFINDFDKTDDSSDDEEPKDSKQT